MAVESHAAPQTARENSLRIRRLGVFLGAEVTEIDLTQPLDRATADAMRQAHAEHGVLVFPNQDISSDDRKRFGRYFGELSVHPFSTNAADAPELIVYDNKEGNPPAPTDIWHTDETFREAPPMGTALCSKIVPQVGGNTAFASMTAVYEGLSDRWQRFLSGLEAVHDFKPFRSLFPDDRAGIEKLRKFEDKYPAVTHPVVSVHPITGRKAIFVNPQFTLLYQGHGGGREPHDPRYAVSQDPDPRVPVPASMAGQHARVLGQPQRPALGTARLLPAAPPDGAREKWPRNFEQRYKWKLWAQSLAEIGLVRRSFRWSRNQRVAHGAPTHLRSRPVWRWRHCVKTRQWRSCAKNSSCTSRKSPSGRRQLLEGAAGVFGGNTVPEPVDLAPLHDKIGGNSPDFHRAQK